MPQRKNQIDPAEQRRRFIKTARKLGCDEDEAAFNEKLRRIGKAKPSAKRDGGKPRGGSD